MEAIPLKVTFPALDVQVLIRMALLRGFTTAPHTNVSLFADAHLFFFSSASARLMVITRPIIISRLVTLIFFYGSPMLYDDFGDFIFVAMLDWFTPSSNKRKSGTTYTDLSATLLAYLTVLIMENIMRGTLFAYCRGYFVAMAFSGPFAAVPNSEVTTFTNTFLTAIRIATITVTLVAIITNELGDLVMFAIPSRLALFTNLQISRVTHTDLATYLLAFIVMTSFAGVAFDLSC